MTKLYEYHVVFSFAGEERKYVKAVATHLQRSKIKVFYDEFEKVNLWGKDLYTHLDNVYRNKGHFCVMFISENYQRKNWTNHERESAQARAFQENEEYILPARFDNTEIPGVRPTIGYISLRNLTPQQFAQIVIQKLKLAGSSALISTTTKPKICQFKNIVKAANINKKKVFQSTHSNLTEPTSKVKHSKATKKAVSMNRHKLDKRTSSSASKGSNRGKYAKLRTKTVALTLEGISNLPNDKPVVYKILTEGRKNNYTGVAKKGNIYAALQEHLQGQESYVPGFKVCIERMDTIEDAQQKANRIIKKSNPKYNKPVE